MQATGLMRRGALWISALALMAPATVLHRPAKADDAPQAINSVCPVMTDEPVDPKITLDYRGRTIAFCCERCRKKFKKDPDRYLAALPLFEGAAQATNVADSGTDHEKSETESGVGDEAEREEEEPFLGRLHPALVHFPLAGVPLALFGFLVWTVTSREAFAKADVPPLLASALFSIAAVITGNIAHDAIRFGRAMHEIVERHEFVSTSVMILILLLTALRIWRWNRLMGRWRWIYGGGLCLAAILLMITGYLGGSLVFGPDHLKL